jgi:hypothetical protein
MKQITSRYIKNYMIFYSIFYLIYVILPNKECGINEEAWKAYFPIKLLLIFMAFLWTKIFNDAKKMMYYRDKDKSKFEYLGKRFVYQNTLIFMLIAVFFVFIAPYILLLIRDVYGVNLSFLVIN